MKTQSKHLYTALCAAILCFSCSDKGGAPTEFIDAGEFSQPGIEYRPVAFYSLNDRLDADVARRQIAEFKDGGFGGVFFHPRIGLITDYLEKPWWDFIDAGVGACEEYGIDAWFYDEDKWPSGYAGGKVPLTDRSFVSQCILRVEKDAELEPGTEVLSEDDRYKYIVNYEQWGQFRFNGTSYVDLLSRDVIATFIDTTYAAYHDRYRDKLGKVVKGIFTDEPQAHPRPSLAGHKGALSYSPRFFETFRELNGYDMTDVLPLLFGRQEGSEKAQSDYYRTIAYMFENNFTKQIGDYCSNNGLIFTGHYLNEESPLHAAYSAGSVMPLYRHMSMPGIDQLGLRYLPVYTPKAMTSVANQYGIPRRLSEAYGISGQNMTFEDRKWLLDWHSLFGINFITPHLSLYSMRGERKRDYPPTFSAPQPYWPYNRIFEDYSARMSYAASVGKYAANIAVLNPIESAWIELDNVKKIFRNDRTDRFDALMEKMQATHRDYDLLDEQIAEEIASVSAKGLKVGEMTYKIVILPHMLTIRESTVDLLRRFAEQGGSVLVAGDYPEYVGAVRNPTVIELLKSFSEPLDEERLTGILYGIYPSEFTLETDRPEQIWTQMRKAKKGGKLIQLTNTSRKEDASCRLRFASAEKKVAIWDPVSGRSYALAAAADGGYDIDFTGTQTWIVTTGSVSREADMAAVYEPRTGGEEVAAITGEWSGRRTGPNVITLDFACYSTDGGKTYSRPEPVLGIFSRLRDNKWDGVLKLRYEADASYSPENCQLVVEDPDMYGSITVNGRPVSFDGGYHLDAAFRKGDIGGMLREGRNEIVLTVDFLAPRGESLDPAERMGTEIEAVYIVGDFGVKAFAAANPLETSERNRAGYLVEKPVMSYGRFEITPEQELFSGNLTDAGYPFYAGGFVLENTFRMDEIDPSQKYYVSLPLFEAIVVDIEVNGSALPPLVFSPYEAEVTGLLREGANDIKITLTNSLRNMLGPHHHAGGELLTVGPRSFTGLSSWTGPDYKGESRWYDVRIDGKPGIWRDDYYMVPFGLLENPVIKTVKH